MAAVVAVDLAGLSAAMAVMNATGTLVGFLWGAVVFREVRAGQLLNASHPNSKRSAALSFRSQKLGVGHLVAAVSPCRRCPKEERQTR